MSPRSTRVPGRGVGAHVGSHKGPSLSYGSCCVHGAGDMLGVLCNQTRGCGESVGKEGGKGWEDPAGQKFS